MQRYGQVCGDKPFEGICQVVRPATQGYYRAGVALSKLQRHAESVEAFSKAAALEPADADIAAVLEEAKQALHKQMPGLPLAFGALPSVARVGPHGLSLRQENPVEMAICTPTNGGGSGFGRGN